MCTNMYTKCTKKLFSKFKFFIFILEPKVCVNKDLTIQFKVVEKGGVTFESKLRISLESLGWREVWAV